MCSITLGLFIIFFLRERERDNKISRVIELKSRVGRVSGNTTIFLGVRLQCIQILQMSFGTFVQPKSYSKCHVLYAYGLVDTCISKAGLAPLL